MTISLLDVISGAQRTGLVQKLLNAGVSNDKAGLAVDTLIPLAVSHLVNVNKDQGTDAALSLLTQDSPNASWPGLDRAGITTQLASMAGLNATQADTAINAVVDSTKTEITGLLAQHSLSDLLTSQHGFIAAAVAALAGIAGFTTNLFGDALGSVGDLASKAGDALKGVAGGAVDLAGGAADAAGNLAGKAGDALKGVAGGAVDLAGDAADAVGDLAGKAGDALKGVAGGAADLAGDAVDAVGNVAGKAGDALKGAAGGAIDLAGDAVDAAGNAIKGVAGAAGHLVGGAAHGIKDGAGAVVGGVAAAGAGIAAGAGAVAKGGTSLFRKLLPFIALAVLALLIIGFLKRCQHTEAVVPAGQNTEAATAVTTAAPLTAAKLNLVTGADGSVSTCKATIGTEEAKATLLAKIKANFGDAANCDITVDATYNTTLPTDDQLNQMFAALKASPNTSLNLDGTAITLDGATPDLLTALKDKLAGLFGSGFTITTAAPLDVAAKVAESTNAAINALKALVPGQTSAQQLTDALNLQIINFASGQKGIPTEAQEVLKEGAALLKQIPDARLAVVGHTDNVGNESANVALSESRAKAVKDFLVQNGAVAAQLKIKGVGSASPKADNATEAGRFANRRIEFLVDDGLDATLK